MSTITERPPFGLSVSQHGRNKIFHMTGRLMDQKEADHMIEVLEQELGSGTGANVILDMSQLQYMNSTGLNILISVLSRTRKGGGETLISGMSTGVKQLFTVTKLDTVFTIKDTVEEALGSLPK
ncbi:MAG: STAS domain-containing protein [Bacteroidetes bacterium]|jgi:anti-anti-sigma factor|nr:STAS domain-containing protein [Bacteroidota bacterium]MBX7129396.1 STAS domain-containing protein [Flavobacteriales bacterium]MCC6656322.1 STAS domain-containing protein [Flavobacteriales bacterium]HMU13975.1 STAS domain-containing protein [Flavobacteriales bacterium]HNA33125.1 STAS domain-containing protein [Flavobacteriales bacterium]